MSGAPLARSVACVVLLAAAFGCSGAPVAPLVPTLALPAEGGLADNACTLDQSEAVVWDFDWSDVPGASSYELWVKHRNSAQPEIDQTGLQTSSHRAGRFVVLEGDMLQGWEWKVRAVVNGAPQPWSKTGTFSIEPLDTDCQ